MGAFRDCSSLASISIPTSVTSIGSFAFDGTPFYNNMPDGVVYINNILYNYKGIMPENTSITVQEGTKSICTNAFRFKSNLTSITIPNSVTSIGNNAFEDCSGLTSITIPNSITIIEYSTFYNCTGLSSITIPNSVTYIKSGAFYGCTGLTSITSLSETPPDIDNDVFYNVNKAIPVYVPEASIPLYQAAEGWQDFYNIQKIGLNDITSTKNIDVLIYPNPAKDKAKIEFEGLNSKADIIVYDIMGREVKRDVIAKGTKELELNISNFKRGVYNVRIVNERIDITKKLVVE